MVEINKGQLVALKNPEDYYFSGGMRGYRWGESWAVYPVCFEFGIEALLFDHQQDHLRFLTQTCGLQYIGTRINEQGGTGAPEVGVWDSGLRDPLNHLHAAESWGAVAHNARQAGDVAYADIAKYLSVSLLLARLRMRDVSTKYNDQLIWALRSRKKVGCWFSNAALLELYADFHSLAAELCSARDYLSRIAAIHVKATKPKKKVDSLATLKKWLSDLPVGHSVGDPIIDLLLQASGTEAQPGWLSRLSAIRNEMLHRLPMGANRRVSGMYLREIKTDFGVIKVVRLGEPCELEDDSQRLEPLDEFAQLYGNMEKLCCAGWKLAKYPADIPDITAAVIS